VKEIEKSPGDIVGLITDVQDFAVHDGPGLRVLVFLKGCPLSCDWCQNPESINPLPDEEISFHVSDCLSCLRCLEVCPVPGAITEDKDRRIDRSRCTRCMRCVDTCLGRALRKVGKLISVEELLEKIVRYKPFFDGSDRGGVTLSGGEPTFQPKFALQILNSCRELGIHTAVETCGYTTYEILKTIAENSDLVLYDIKCMDEAKHTKHTGKSNSLILKNLKRLCKEVNTEIVIRIPLISGFNDDDENVRESAGYVSMLGKVQRLDLLPFNALASAKYKALGKEWKYENMSQQSDERLARLRQIVETYGLETTIGGLW